MTPIAVRETAGVRGPHHGLCQCSCEGVHDRWVAGQEAKTWMEKKHSKKNPHHSSSPSPAQTLVSYEAME